MKIILNLIALAGLTCFGTGCVVHQPQVSHHPRPAPVPPPARPPVVVVHQSPGRPSQPQPPPSRAAKEPWVNVNITVGERQLIREYVATCSENDNHHNQGNRGKDKHAGKHRGNGKDKPLPPGLARKVARGETLPPGWQKKVVKGEILPVEVYRECHPLPSEVVVKLPPPPAGTVLVTIEGKVVRLLQATREILDVFEVHG